MSKFASVFNQILKIFPRGEFNRAVIEHKAEYRTKGFSCWLQFVSMMFCQIGQAHSLREICGGLASSMGKLTHLGIPEAPKRSSLSYANKHRPWQLYQTIFYQMLQTCKSQVGTKRKFRFKNKLLSLDSTLILLCASLFDWAKYTQLKGAVKLHLLLDHDGYLPAFACISDGKTYEIEIARALHLPPGSILAIDRGYRDYGLYYKWTEEGVYFVTMPHADMLYEVVEEREIPKKSNILKDQTIRLTGKRSRRRYPDLLRLVEVYDKKKDKIIALLTNHHDFGATTISAIYKDRWNIETFFKLLKQNLRIKTFVGTSPNALLTQIWTALIAILVLKYMQFRSSFGWSMSNLVAMLRYNLFSYRDLWEWLDSPYQPPPVDDEVEQLVFVWR